jgi:hypothetical protein
LIACDTSTLAAFLAGDPSAPDVVKLRRALQEAVLVLPPAALAEATSNPATRSAAQNLFAGLPLLEPQPDYWLRVGAARAALMARGLKARLADALIAQSCIDAGAALITRDHDFRHYAAHCGLVLA